MRTASVLLAALLVPALAHAGGEHIPTSARFAGLGNAGSTLIDLWCVNGNQAGLAGLEHPVAGAFYQQHWLSPDLAMQGLAFALPYKQGTFGITANSFGNMLYAQRSFGLAYAMKLNDGLRVGVQLDYLNIRLGEGYGSTGAVTAELGVQAKLAEHLWIGAHLYNPNRAKLGGPYDERTPTEIRAGLAYIFNDQVTLSGEVSKDIDRPEQYHAGVEYRPTQALFLRTGISTGPTKAHFGAGFRVKQLELDLAAVLRSQLGLTPMVNLNYRFP
jgi:hypothetical protein